MVDLAGHALLYFGCIEVEKHGKIIQSPILLYLSIILDTHIEFSKYFISEMEIVRNLFSSIPDSGEDNYIQNRIAEDVSILYRILLYLTFETDYTQPQFLFCYEFLRRYSKSSKNAYPSISIFLGVSIILSSDFLFKIEFF